MTHHATTNLQSALHLKLIGLAETAAGFSASEVTGHSPEQVRRAAEALVGAGRMVRRKVSPRRVRYFLSADLAAAYSAAPPTAQPVAGTRMKAAWRSDEPGIITARTKIVIAPPLPHSVFKTNTYQQF